jgi:nuclear RNA export factor
MGDSVIITAIKEDIIELQKLDQFIFAGTTLHIKPCEPFEPGRLTRDSDRKGGSVAPSTQETKEKLKAILANRYDGNLKLLNLSSLTQDAGLVEMGLGSLDGKVTSKLFPALMVVCDGLFDSSQAKREAIVSVSLAGNALTTVTAVTSLAQTFPGIKNLDLSGNNLTDLKSLEAWRWKFRTLENLVLTSNPIELQSPNYKNEIMRWYPKLQILNGVAVRTAEEIAAAAQIDNSPIPISGPDFRDVAQVGENFIKQFLPLYDSNRASLLDILYDNQSIHSISINMSSPRDRENSTPVPAWAAYIPYSRNLTKITRIEARMSRQYHGLGAIKKVWNNLPATRHPDLATNFDKYMIECHPLPGLADPSGQSPRGVDGLILNIHGEFEEEVSPTEKGIRSFSRTFILSPGQPGGIPIRVISDMMTLRAHAPLALPKVDHSTQQIQQAPVQQIQQTQITQDDITRQLVEKTGMTPEYSVMCLTETGWDLEKAFVAFNANKVSTSFKSSERGTDANIN